MTSHETTDWGKPPSQYEEVPLSTAELIIAQAEAELNKLEELRNHARQVLSETQTEYSRWRRVIDTLRPPEPTPASEKKKGGGVLQETVTRAISDAKLDEFLVGLRENYEVGQQFLTRDAALVCDVTASYMVKVLQELRMRGDVRLAGRAPGKGIVPLFALVPETVDVDRQIEREDES